MSDVDVTTLTVTVELSVEAPVAAVFEALADPTRTPRWSPECVAVSWVEGWDRAEPGARFQGHNRIGDREWDVTCEITEVRPPQRLSWVVLGFDGDPRMPSSTWTYTLGEQAGRTLVTETFQHGGGGSHLATTMANQPARAEAVLNFRRDLLRDNMRATLTAMAREYGWPVRE